MIAVPSGHAMKVTAAQPLAFLFADAGLGRSRIVDPIRLPAQRSSKLNRA
jgi:hypothetical protein